MLGVGVGWRAPAIETQMLRQPHYRMADGERCSSANCGSHGHRQNPWCGSERHQQVHRQCFLTLPSELIVHTKSEVISLP